MVTHSAASGSAFARRRFCTVPSWKNSRLGPCRTAGDSAGAELLRFLDGSGPGAGTTPCWTRRVAEDRKEPGPCWTRRVTGWDTGTGWDGAEQSTTELWRAQV